ncbi:MAG TPA: aldo/keto reductase [Bacteroidetes bacterium]|nr:aldo/keto reductase [Bacteroidota bacterium]
MQYRQLGDSGLRISEVSLGTWLTYGTHLSRETSIACFDKAIELGINFFDTADMYNRGEAEKVLGDYLKLIPREQIIIGTKVFGPMSDHWMNQGLSLRHIRTACETSLQRLHTDYIDLYQCHRYDIDTPLEETCYAMHNLIERGYILHWGVSQWTAIQILQAIRVCEKNGWHKPVSNQPIYNMLNRSLEVDVMDVCEKEGLGLVVYSPLAQGLLSGKYKKGHVPEGSRMAHESAGKMFPSKRMTDEYFAQQEQLLKLADDLNISMASLALSWILQHKPVTSVIMGATTPEQVEENCSASAQVLSEDIMENIETILGNAPIDQYSGARVGYGIVKRGY